MGDAEELVEWMRQHKLMRVKDALTDEENLGIISLQDLKCLNDADVHDVAILCNMNIGERNRFKTAVRQLQENAGTGKDGEKARVPAEQAPAHDSKTCEEQEEVQWFEVVKRSMVVVKCAPSTDARDLCCVWLGQTIQVKQERAVASDGHEWVELTALQLLLSCGNSAEPGVRGFALIDGTHIGLGPLLRQRDSDPGPDQQRAEEGDDGHKEQQKCSAPQARTALAARGDQHSAAQFRPSPFRSAGRGPANPQGADEVELQRQQPRLAEDAAARKARAERMREARAAKAEQGSEAPAERSAEEREEREERKERKEREEREEREEVLRGLCSIAEQQQRQEQALRKSCSVYRAVHGVVYTMPPGDPAQGSMERTVCVPGAAFYCTGKERTGLRGAVWLERRRLGSSSACGWVLLQGPGPEEDGPLLVREDEMHHRARVEVKYLADGLALSFRVFETCLSTEHTVRTLRARLCSETGLKASSTVLLPKLGGQFRCDLLLKASRSEAGLQDDYSLAEYALLGEVQLYLLYASDFEADFQGGRWSAKSKR